MKYDFVSSQPRHIRASSVSGSLLPDPSSVRATSRKTSRRVRRLSLSHSIVSSTAPKAVSAYSSISPFHVLPSWQLLRSRSSSQVFVMTRKRSPSRPSAGCGSPARRATAFMTSRRLWPDWANRSGLPDIPSTSRAPRYQPATVPSRKSRASTTSSPPTTRMSRGRHETVGWSLPGAS